MKNSSKLLALGLVLFLGACSATEDAKGDFLSRVKGKTAYGEATHDTEYGTFSEDGTTLTPGGVLDGQPTLTFSKTTDDNTAEYTLTGTILTFMTTDGKSGTMTSGTMVTKAWLKVK